MLSSLCKSISFLHDLISISWNFPWKILQLLDSVGNFHWNPSEYIVIWARCFINGVTYADDFPSSKAFLLTLSSASEGENNGVIWFNPWLCTLSRVTFPWNGKTVYSRERRKLWENWGDFRSLATMKLWYSEKRDCMKEGGNLSSQDTSLVLIRPSVRAHAWVCVANECVILCEKSVFWHERHFTGT